MGYNLDFSKGLIPAIIQDYKTGSVLMLAYMDEDAFDKTMDTKKTCFCSSLRNMHWNIKEDCEHFQDVKEIFVDCDRATILIKVEQVGAACHTGSHTCFFTKLESLSYTG